VSLRHELRTALEAADAADAVTAPRFRAHDLAVEVKSDATPVSEADRAAEQAIRRVIGDAFPGDGILGEEYGEESGSGRRWIIDPIDATVNYVRGVPVWGSLIGLEDDGEIVVGVVSAPSLGSRWWASRGAGSWHNSRRMRVSGTNEIADAHLSINSLKTCLAGDLSEAMLALIDRCDRLRSFGDFWSFMLLAEGAVDVVVEPVAAIWDLAPLQVIVEEAGGRMTDRSGRRAVDGGNAVATNGLLHEGVLEVLRG
jgi:histidinol-phosphatase